MAFFHSVPPAAKIPIFVGISCALKRCCDKNQSSVNVKQSLTPSSTGGIFMSIDANNHYLRRIEYTGTEHFPEGTELDLIRDAEGRPILAIRGGKTGELRLTQQLTYQEHIIYRPLREPAAWLRAIRLPNAINNEPTPLGELFDALLSFLDPLDETCAVLMAAFAFSTWWTGKLAYAPLLLLSGAGATSILTRLEMVCRRGVVLTGTNSCGSFPEKLRPTLLAKCDSRRFAAKFLREQPWAGAPVWRAGNLVDAFTARVAALEAEADPLPGVLNLVVDQELPPARIDADEIQAKLLGYRMAHWNNLPSPADPPSDPALATLLFASGGEEELQSRLLEAYALNKGESDPKAEAEEECAVVSVLAGFVGSQRAWAYVAEIADGANAALHTHGSSTQLSPRQLGDILRRLGLYTERNNRGRGLKFSAEAKQRIEELAKNVEDTHPAGWLSRPVPELKG
jgi:hypothetical protein